MKGLKGKEDKGLEEINTQASTPTAIRFGEERTFKTMLMGEQKQDRNPIVFHRNAKTPYQASQKIDDEILDPHIVDIKTLISSFKDTTVELATYSLKARV